MIYKGYVEVATKKDKRKTINNILNRLMGKIEWLAFQKTLMKLRKE